jgi:flagellar biosynthesis protein FliQ
VQQQEPIIIVIPVIIVVPIAIFIAIPWLCLHLVGQPFTSTITGQIIQASGLGLP